ncbi:hypothetical protein LT493_15270 [Streptomyces tricolor]|nr:hypothetical protein [Streptomyces tricolor]
MTHAHEPLLRSARQQESFALFAAEYDNLVRAAGRRRGTGRGRGGPAASLRCTGTGPRCATTHAPRPWWPRSAGWATRCPRTHGPPSPRSTLLAGDGDPAPGHGTGPCVIEDCARTGALERYPMLLLLTLPMGSCSVWTMWCDPCSGRCAGARTGGPWAVRSSWRRSSGTNAVTGGPGGGDGRRPARVRGGGRRRVHGDRHWRVWRRVRSVQGRHQEAGRRLYRRGLAPVPRDECRPGSGSPPNGCAAATLAGRPARYRRGRAGGAGPRGDDLAGSRLWSAGPTGTAAPGQPDRADLQLDRMEALAGRRPWPGGGRAGLGRAGPGGEPAHGRRCRTGARLLPGAVGVQALRAPGCRATAAQHLAGLLLAEGDPAGAATALG